MRHGLLLSQHYFLNEEQKTQVKEYTRIAKNHLRFRQNSMESLQEKDLTKKNLVSLGVRCFDRMARLTLYLAEWGLIFIDYVYNELSELALTYLKIDKRDIMASMVVDIDGKGGNSVNGRPAGNEAGAEARTSDCKDTHDEDHEVQPVGPLKADDENVPSSKSAQESPETHNVRRQKEIAEAEEHLLGSVMTVGCDGPLKPIDVTEKRSPSTYIRQASNQHVEDEMINENMPSKTSKTSGITSKDFSDVGLEVQSLFQRPKPTKV